MGKYFDSNFLIATLIVSAVCVNCVPTSVLLNSKAVVSGSNKVKRTTSSSQLTESNEKHSQHSDEIKQPLQKRGVNSKYFERDMPTDVYANSLPNGVWEDTEPGVVYPSLQDFDEYRPGPYRSKGYDNLQSILNANMYEEPLALPIQYSYPRYYPERKKRSNGRNISLRLKREPKLSPADMLALVALVEASEHARIEDENEDGTFNYPKSLVSPYDLPSEEDNGEWWNTWTEPAVQYYGNAYNNLESIPRYELVKENHQNMYPSKRFMVAKKKRSLNPRDWRFHTNPKVSIAPGFDSRMSLPEILDNGSRKYHTKYF